MTKEPLDWTDVGYVASWTGGGVTSLDNLVLLCRHHHRMIQEPKTGWQVRMDLDDLPEFLPPPWIDHQE